MSFINKFNIFSEIDENLVNNILLYYLTDFYLLFITSDNAIYQYKLIDKILKRVEFCERHVIIKIDCSHDHKWPHFMALTDDGRVYSWGDNRNGQLGNGNTKCCDKPKNINSLSQYSIIEICCGFRHTLVLTRNGNVFAFGSNERGQCGTNDKTDQLIPIQINLPKVAAISCGDWHSMLLTGNGDVFGCGWNKFGQLGIADVDEQSTATKLNVPKTKQIMCGVFCSLMLSTDGDIYFCGTIDCLSYNNPTKFNKSNKFIKIAASIHSLLCVALTTNSVAYIFGKYNKKVTVKELQQTKLTSINDTYAFYEKITYRSMKMNLNVSKYKFNFTELCPLGSGGFGTVFKAEFKFNHTLFAIKKISFDEENSDKVTKELTFLSALQSDFVVKYNYSWIEHNYYIGSNASAINANSSFNESLFSANKTQLLHIQMELCPFTLRNILNLMVNTCKTTNNKLSLIGYYVSSEILYEILECLQYLHSKIPSIIHRDLKPENILITYSGNNRFVKLSDFGLSTFQEIADQSHTKYKGTIGYRAPELNYSTKYTSKVDNYSLGVIMQELFNLQDSSREEIQTDSSLKSQLIRLLNLRTQSQPLNDESLLCEKIEYVFSLANRLLLPQPEQRPNCDQIIAEQHVWRLTYNDVLKDEDFAKILSHKVDSLEENFISFFIQKKYDAMTCNPITIDNESKLTKLIRYMW